VSAAAETAALPAEVAAFLARAGRLDPARSYEAEALTGGVSSDIWRVAQDGRALCVKRARPKLRTAEDWRAPVERNRYERLWCEVAGARVPGFAPLVLAHDDAAGLFAMEWLAPDSCRLWKAELAAGRVDPEAAGAVGARLGRLHAATAAEPALAEAFPTLELFRALRLDPYLGHLASRRPDLAPRLRALIRETEAARIALVHGDVSPKNVLLCPEGPVLLDAECAWWGDPAFDLAFCLNHLLLKAFLAPPAALAAAFVAFLDAWVEAAPALGAAPVRRAAALLPALMLARVDGKSPVEYLDTEVKRDRVRRFAAPRILAPPPDPQDVADAWLEEWVDAD
jgi:fructosamine-3-kinase